MRRLLCGITVATATSAACFADLDGYAGPPREDATTADVPVVEDAGTDAADTSTIVDAACAPKTTIDNTFASDVAPFAKRALRAAGYPKNENILGTPAAVLLPIVNTAAEAGELLDARSGLWLTTAVPLVAFDVDFDFLVRCTSASSCADGLMVTWLDTTDATVIDNENTGSNAGVPEAIGGGAFVVDNYLNEPAPAGTSDPAPPTLQIIAFDPTKPVGTYAWVNDHKTADFRVGWHTVSLRGRGKSVSVRYDNADLFVGTTNAVTKGLFGMSAGTGGESDAVALKNFRARFYDCTP